MKNTMSKGYKAGFDPDQPRDEQGRWSAEGGGNIDKYAQRIAKVTGVDNSNINYVAQKLPSGTIGHSTRSVNGKPQIEVDIDKIREGVESGKYDGLNDWFQISGEINEESLIEHVVAHETGHWWWSSQSIMSSDLVKLPSGNRGRIETNPILNDWRDNIWSNNKSAMSGYSRYYNSYTEGFADSFAAFATGQQLDESVENWFLENLK